MTITLQIIPVQSNETQFNKSVIDYSKVQHNAIDYSTKCKIPVKLNKMQSLVFETCLKLGKLQCKSNFNRN